MAGKQGLDEESYLKILEEFPSDYDTDTDVEPVEDSEYDPDPPISSDSLDKAQSKDRLAESEGEATKILGHSSSTINQELCDQEHPSTSTNDQVLSTSCEAMRPSTSSQGQQQARRCWRKKPEAAQNVHFKLYSCDKDSYSSALQIFLEFFDEDIINSLVHQTNLYSVQKNKPISHKKDELLVFLGINIMMGYHKLPSLHHY